MMLAELETLDVQLFVFLNSFGSEDYDFFWSLITQQRNWIPLFLIILYSTYKKIGIKQSLYLLLFIAILIAFTDQTTNFVKSTVQRLRPCNNTDINTIIRVVQFRNSFSFFSGHASNSMAVTTFLFLVLRKDLFYLRLLFLWPLIFAYSRIYLGLHYPGDIIIGYFCGFCFGYLFYKSYLVLQKKYFPKSSNYHSN